MRAHKKAKRVCFSVVVVFGVLNDRQYFVYTYIREIIPYTILVAISKRTIFAFLFVCSFVFVGRRN